MRLTDSLSDLNMQKSTSTDAARAQLSAVYGGILNRELDAGADDKVKRLAAGTSSLEDLIREIVGSEEYRTLIHESGSALLKDQTQYGELEILLKLWVNAQARHRIVVDVGARGRDRSNSYDLMRSFGWRGVLYEANPNLVPSIQAEFNGLDFELIQAAVSDYNGEAVFHLGANDDVSSLNADAASGWGPIVGAVAVEVRRLGESLKSLSIPSDFDLISIDIEGEDIKVLNDLVDNFDYRPRWVIIEASYDFTVKALTDLPFSDKVRESYALVGQTVANLILQHIAE